MKFDVLGRDVDLKLTHVLLSFGAFISLSIALYVIAFLASSIVSGGLDALLFEEYRFLLTIAFSIINLPLLALVLISIIGILKMKKDRELCRSLATGTFVLFALFVILSAVSLFVIQVYSFQNFFFGILANLATALSNAILLYLWLLMFLKIDKERLAFIGPYALLFSLLMLVVTFSLDAFELGVPALSYFEEHLPVNLAITQYLPMFFLFAVPLLYFTLGKKWDMDSAYLFSASYLGANLLYIFMDYSPSTAIISYVYSFIESSIELLLLYLLAKYGSNNV